MADINKEYNLLKYRATKAGYNGNISPDDFNLVWPRAEQRYFNKLYKQYELSQEIGESLMPFKTDPIPITIDGTGKFTKPNNILHIDSLRAPFSGVQTEVRRFSDDRIANKLKSKYDPPTLEFPVYVEYSTYLQFYPINLTSAIFVYLKDLVTSKWAYTLVGGRPVYDAGNSVQPQWNADDLDEISYIALSDIGINMRDVQLDQFAERKIQTNL